MIYIDSILFADRSSFNKVRSNSMKWTKAVGKALIVSAVAVWLAGCSSTGSHQGVEGGPVGLGPSAATKGVYDPAVMAVIKSGKIKGSPEQIAEWLHQTTFHYDTNEYAVNPQDYNALNATAALMNTHYMDGKKLVIEGNTDERGTRSYNMALGLRRASAVKHYLEAKGVPSERMRVISYGFEKPVDTAHDPAAWAKNRRVTIVDSTLPHQSTVSNG